MNRMKRAYRFISLSLAVLLTVTSTDMSVFAMEEVINDSIVSDSIISESIARESVLSDEMAGDAIPNDDFEQMDSAPVSTEWINPAFEEYDGIENLLDSIVDDEGFEEVGETDDIGVIDENGEVELYSENLVNSASPAYDAREFEDAARFVRNAMTDREHKIFVTVEDSVLYDFARTSKTESERKEALKNYMSLFLKSVYRYDESSEDKNIQGDYLRYHTVVLKFALAGATRNGSNYIYIFRVTPVYSTSKEQELIVTEQVKNILGELDVDNNYNSIDKVRGIYDYITSHSVYDYDSAERYKNVEEDDFQNMDLTPWSTYGLLNNKARDSKNSNMGVCQAYATLLYRLLQDAGVPCRAIVGNPDSKGKNSHSWNIINVGGAWYNADATWDTKETREGRPKSIQPGGHEYYLKSNADFSGHTRSSEFVSEEFNTQYPMTSISYPVDETVAGPYNISFYTGDSSIVIPNQDKNLGEKIDEPVLSPRKGYIFEGWYSGSGTVNDHKWDFESDTVEGAVNLRAHWIDSGVPAYKINGVSVNSVATMVEIKDGDRLSLGSSRNAATIIYTMDGSIPDKEANPDNTKIYEDVISVRGNVGDTITVNAASVWCIDGSQYKSEVASIVLKIADESEDWGRDIDSEDKQEFIDDGKTAYDLPSSDELWVRGIKESVAYTGSAITFPELRVYKGKKLLTSGTDYTVKYTNNVNVGKATINITGRGSYAGNIVKTFEITAVDISTPADPSEKVVYADDVFVNYNKKVQKAKTKVEYKNVEGKLVTLKEGRDYTLTFDGTDNKAPDYDSRAFNEPGTYTVRAIGKGNYFGETSYKVHITNIPLISKASINNLKDQQWTGSAIEAPFDLYMGREKLTKDVDYSAYYSNNVDCGTAVVSINGLSNKCAGNKTATFKITGKKIDKILFTSAFVYDGTAKKPNISSPESQEFTVMTKGTKNAPSVSVPYKNNESDPDDKANYEVTYAENVNAGSKATIIITGKNGYEGTVKKTFRIDQYEMKKEEGNRITVLLPSRVVYSKGGATIKVYDPAEDFDNEIAGYVKATGYSSKFADMLVVKDGDKYLRPGVDFTVSYANNKAVADKKTPKEGEDVKYNNPSVIIRGKGNYKGSITEEFSIVKKHLDQEGMVIKVSDIVANSTKSNICKPSITITDTDGKTLKAGTDYDLISYTYVNDTNVKVKIANNQYDTVRKNAGDVVGKDDIIPVGTKIKVTVYAKNDEKCNYAGSVSEIFRFVQSDISKASISIKDQVYTGKPVEITKDDILKIRIGSTDLLKSDFEIESYSNNINKGTAKVVIKGAGNYGGRKTVSFKIVAKSMNYVVEYYGKYIDGHDDEGTDITGTMKNSYIALNSRVSGNNFKRPYYDFAGWAWDSSSRELIPGEDVIPNKGALRRNPLSAEIYGDTIKLYARWTLTPYKINYKLNGGKNSNLNPTVYTYGGSSIPLYNAVKRGYEFDGWYTSSKFKAGTLLDSISPENSGNITLYAKWRKTGEVSQSALGLEIDVDAPCTLDGNTLKTPDSGDVTFKMKPLRKSENYRYKINSVALKIGNEFIPEIDSTKMTYQDADTYNYKFVANGTYKIRFTVMDSDAASKETKYVDKIYNVEILSDHSMTLEEKVEEIVEACKAELGGSYLENKHGMAVLLHDKLMSMAKYDDTGMWCGATGVLLRGEGTSTSPCIGTDESFAYAYKMLLDKALIENSLVTANGHTWNMASLDGCWTHIDVTADDEFAEFGSADERSKLSHMYFGITDEQIKRIYPAFAQIKTRKCVAYDANYYKKTGEMEYFAGPVRNEIFAGISAGKTVFNVAAVTENAIRNIDEVYAVIEPVVGYYLSEQLPGAKAAYIYNTSKPENSYFTVNTIAKSGGLMSVSSNSLTYNPVGTNTYYINDSGVLVCDGLTDAAREGNVKNSQKWTFYFAKKAGYYGKAGYGENAATAGADARFYNKGEALGGYMNFDDDDELIARSDSYSSDTPYYFDINTGARKKVLLYYHGGYYVNPISAEQTELIDSIGRYAATDLKFASTSGYESSVIYATISDDYPRAASKYITGSAKDSAGSTYTTGEAYGGNKYENVAGYENARFYDPKNDYVNGSDVGSVTLSVSSSIDSNGRTVLNVVRSGEEIPYTIKHNIFDRYNGKHVGVENESHNYKAASGTTGTPDGIINCYDMEAYCKATYKWAINTYGAENVVLCGASSGAGLCTSLLQWAAVNDIAGPGVRDIPADTILISPWFDASMAVAEAGDKNRSGNGVDYGTLCYWGKVYTRVHTQSSDPDVDVTQDGKDLSVPMNYAVDNAFASPVSKANSTLSYSGLGNITCYTGGKDACLGNAKAFKERCTDKEGTTLSYIYYGNEPHGFVFGANTHRQDVVNAMVRKMMMGLE